MHPNAIVVNNQWSLLDSAVNALGKVLRAALDEASGKAVQYRDAQFGCLPGRLLA